MQFGSFWTNGQICSSTSRLVVHQDIAQAFYAQLKARAESIKIADPMEEDCRMGAVVNAVQHQKIMHYIKVWAAHRLLALSLPIPRKTVAGTVLPSKPPNQHCSSRSKVVLTVVIYPLRRWHRRRGRRC